MKKFLPIFLVIALLSIVLTSCKKDDPEPTKTDLLTQKTWIGISEDYYVNGQLIETYDLTDMQLTFKTDKTYNYSQGDINGNGTWSFLENETRLSLTEGDETIDRYIEILSETSLVISDTGVDVDGTSKDVMSFKH